MKKLVLTIWALGCALLLLSQPVLAQKMYRCGSVYQDRPCAGGQEGKTIGSHGAPVPTSSTGTASVDSGCAKRGGDALKIKWVREAGKSAAQQQASAATSYEQELIADVYNRPGTAGEVRKAIEADCMAQKEREAQAAAMVSAAQKLRGDSQAGKSGSPQTSPAMNSSGNPPVSTRPMPQDTSAATSTAADSLAAAKKQRCEQLRSDRDSIASQERAGGSIPHLDSLKQQRRDNDQALRKAGC